MTGEFELCSGVLASGTIERALTQLLTRNARCRGLLAKLDGKVIVVSGLPVVQQIYLLPFAAGIQIDTDLGDTPDLTITGTPSAFARFAVRGLRRNDLRGGLLGFSGDTVVAEHLKELLVASAIDWPRLMGGILPESLADGLLGPIRALRDWGTGSAASLECDIGEFLSEEVREVATAAETEEFCAEVDRLRDDCDRIEVRIERLKSLLGEQIPGTP